MSKKVNVLTSFLVILSMVLIAVLSGCGNKADNDTTNKDAETPKAETPSAETPKPAEGKTMKLTFAMDLSPTDSWTQASKKFAEIVKEKTNGRIEITVHDSATLGPQRQALEGILAGTVHGTMATEPLSYWVEDINLYGIPYLFRDQAHLDKFLASDAGTELHQKLIDKGFRPITYFNRPPRQVTSNKPINSIADMKGLKIRVPESSTAPAAFKAMGAAPVTMNFAELYSSLETGVLDAQENPLTSIFFNKLHEVQDHLAYTNHQYQVGYMIFSEKTYQSLSDEDKKIIDEAAQEAKKFESDMIQEIMKTIEGDLEKAGVTFTHPDIKPFAEAAKGAYSGYTPLMQDWIKKIQAIQ